MFLLERFSVRCWHSVRVVVHGSDSEKGLESCTYPSCNSTVEAMKLSHAKLTGLIRQVRTGKEVVRGDRAPVSARQRNPPSFNGTQFQASNRHRRLTELQSSPKVLLLPIRKTFFILHPTMTLRDPSRTKNSKRRQRRKRGCSSDSSQHTVHSDKGEKTNVLSVVNSTHLPGPERLLFPVYRSGSDIRKTGSMAPNASKIEAELQRYTPFSWSRNQSRLVSNKSQARLSFMEGLEDMHFWTFGLVTGGPG
ncbi:hypothetical protein PM082_021185 [Marasmius tenuissimus]|nr:hypothetical protein PM082_021185 [Marasmius tenuissimus]